MSRSGYSEDCDNLWLYRGTVERSLKGKRGQQFLRDLAAALDAMPEKVLIEGELIDQSGQCCTIGTVCKARGLDVSKINYEDPQSVARAIGVSWQMAAEIAYENDEGLVYWREETPQTRWQRMRKWANDNLLPEKPNEKAAQ